MRKKITRYLTTLLVAAEVMTSFSCPAMAGTTDINTASSSAGAIYSPGPIDPDDLFYPVDALTGDQEAWPAQDNANTAVPEEWTGMNNTDTISPVGEATPDGEDTTVPEEYSTTGNTDIIAPEEEGLPDAGTMSGESEVTVGTDPDAVPSENSESSDAAVPSETAVSPEDSLSSETAVSPEDSLSSEAAVSPEDSLSSETAVSPEDSIPSEAAAHAENSVLSEDVAPAEDSALFGDTAQSGNEITTDPVGSVIPEETPADAVEPEQALGSGQRTGISEPEGLSVSENENGDYILSWDPVDGAAGYQIYNYDVKTSEWRYLCYWSADAGNSHTIRRNSVGWGEHRYTVSAFDDSEIESTYGNNSVVFYTVPQPVCWVESHLSKGKITFSFASNYDRTQVSGLEIHRILDSGSWTKIKDISVDNFDQNTGATTVDDTDIMQAGTYSYRCRFYYTTEAGRKYGSYSAIEKTELTVSNANGLSLSLIDNKVKVSINCLIYGNGDGFNDLEVYRQHNNESWEKIRTIKRAELMYEGHYCSTDFDDEISGSGSWRYRYRFCIGSSNGEFSDIETVYHLKTPVIRSITTSTNKITLKWAPDDQATGWHIELSQDGYGNPIKIFDFEAGQSDYTIDLNNIENIPDYYSGIVLKIRLFADNSNTQSADVVKRCIYLARPELSGAVSTSASKVDLTWGKIEGASGYKIYRYNTSTKKYLSIGTIENGSKTSFTDDKRKANTKYTYKVKAFRQIGKVTYTSAASIACDVWTLPKQSTVKIVNSLAGKKIKPQIQSNSIPVSEYLWADGSREGSWSYASAISDFIDYKGYYTIVYPSGDYLIIRRIHTGRVKVAKTLKIKKKYETIGGVICDTKGNYYVAWGKADSTEKGEIVTFAVSKYNYNGQHMGTCACKGKSIDTKIPFIGGNCAITIDNGKLICHFAREMYKRSDGKNHQGSQYCIVNTENMKKTNPGYYLNYASHSFNQRILTRKGGGVLYTDLGDSYPRGIRLNESGPDGIYVTPFHFNDKVNNKFINAQLGEVVDLSTGYMIVGTSGKSLNTLDGNMQLFIQIIDRATGKSVLKASTRKGTSCGEAVTDTGVKWLTNYSSSSYACNVQAARTEGDRVVIMWERIGKNGIKIGTYYMVISASGTILQNATPILTNQEIRLNATEELKYHNGHVYWSTCVYDESMNPLILNYKMNVTPGMGVIPDEVTVKSARKTASGITVTWNKAKNATQYHIYRKLGKDGKWGKLAKTSSLTYTDKTAKEGRVYYYTVKGYNTKAKIFGDMNGAGLKAQ